MRGVFGKNRKWKGGNGRRIDEKNGQDIYIDGLCIVCMVDRLDVW